MKYIRTKDGIYTLITKDEPIYELNGKKYYCVEELISSFGEDEVIKQANAIAELSDEFVIINNVDKHPYRMSVRALNDLLHNNDDRSQYSGSSEICFDYAKEKFKAVKEFIGTKENHDPYANYIYEKNPDFELDISLYAYIWVVGSNGAPILKPVAKMNDNEDLELL